MRHYFRTDSRILNTSFYKYESTLLDFLYPICLATRDMTLPLNACKMYREQIDFTFFTYFSFFLHFFLHLSYSYNY